MKDFLKKHNFNLEISDKKAYSIFNILSNIAFFICIIAFLLLILYNKLYISKHLLESSILIFRAGIIMLIFSFICAVFFSNYINENK